MTTPTQGTVCNSNVNHHKANQWRIF